LAIKFADAAEAYPHADTEENRISRKWKISIPSSFTISDVEHSGPRANQMFSKCFHSTEAGCVRTCETFYSALICRYREG
jgi:hypothetical protein